MYLFIFFYRANGGNEEEEIKKERETDRPKFIDRWPFLLCLNFYEMVVLAVINNKTPPLNRLVREHEKGKKRISHTRMHSAYSADITHSRNETKRYNSFAQERRRKLLLLLLLNSAATH